MQTLYGQRVTDRLTINFDPIAMCYVGEFDGVEFTRKPTGQAVLTAFREWRMQVDRERKAEDAAKAQEAIDEQNRADQEFLDGFAALVGVPCNMMDELIEVIKRRIQQSEE